MEAANRAGPNKIRPFCIANGMILLVFFADETRAQYPTNSTVTVLTLRGQRIGFFSLQKPPMVKAMQNQVLVFNMRHTINAVKTRKIRMNITAAAMEGT